MPSSQEWRLYFEENARSLMEVPWDVGAELTPAESAAIGRSLAEFQRGESSEGRHLFHYAKDYSQRTGDSEYVVAVKLFIAEEQRHGRVLAQFLTLNNIPLVATTFTDQVFRRLRNLYGGLETSIGVLITAEIIAQVYYAALREATQSTILRRLCEQILCDEDQHVRFQSEQLAKLRQGHSRGRKWITMRLQRFLFWGTTYVVWLLHRKALRAGHFSRRGFRRACWDCFHAAFHPSPLQAGAASVKLADRSGASSSVQK